MLRSNSFRFPLGLAAAVITAVAVASAQRSAETTGIDIVQRLLRAAYPDVASRNYSVAVSLSGQFDTDWLSLPVIGVVVRPLGEEPGHPSSSDKDQPFLTAFCQFNPSRGYVESATFKGRHVHERENQELTDLARAHPEWTTTEIQAWLTRARAKYGPDQRQAFLRDLKIERFAGILGEIRKLDAAFSLHRDVSGYHRPDVVWSMWMVSLETRWDGNVRMCHGMSFEPFEGRLTFLTTRPCD